MADVLVVNASPLILFARIDRLDLFAKLAGSVVVPQAVLREVEAGSARDQAVAHVRRMASLTKVADRQVPDSIRAWDLGAGESQVLVHAVERPGAGVVLDDLGARRCAQSLGLPMMGSIGVVLLCRQRGIVEWARPLIEALCEVGLRLRPAIKDQALAKVGE